MSCRVRHIAAPGSTACLPLYIYYLHDPRLIDSSLGIEDEHHSHHQLTSSSSSSPHPLLPPFPHDPHLFQTHDFVQTDEKGQQYTISITTSSLSAKEIEKVKEKSTSTGKEQRLTPTKDVNQHQKHTVTLRQVDDDDDDEADEDDEYDDSAEEDEDDDDEQDEDDDEDEEDDDLMDMWVAGPSLLVSHSVLCLSISPSTTIEQLKDLIYMEADWPLFDLDLSLYYQHKPLHDHQQLNSFVWFKRYCTDRVVRPTMLPPFLMCSPADPCACDHCFTPDHQVLTRYQGFKYIQDLDWRHEEIATYNAQTQCLEYQPVERYIDRYVIEEPVIDVRQESRDFSWEEGACDEYGKNHTRKKEDRNSCQHHHHIAMTTTTDHDWYGCFMPHLTADHIIDPQDDAPALDCYHKVKAKELSSRNDSYDQRFRLLTSAINGIASSSEHTITPASAAANPSASTHLPFVDALGLTTDPQINAFLKFYGYWIVNGSVSLEDASAYSVLAEDSLLIGAVVLRCTQRADMEFLQHQINTFHLTDYVCSTTHKQIVYRIFNDQWYHYFYQESKAICSNSAETCLGSWIWQLSKAQLRVLIAGIHRSDNTDTDLHHVDDDGSNTRHIYTSCIRLRDQLIQALLHAGYCAHFTIHCATADSLTTTSPSTPVWCICYHECKLLNHQPTIDCQEDVHTRLYTGQVHCVTVPNGLIFARRAYTHPRTGLITKASCPVVIGNCQRLDGIRAQRRVKLVLKQIEQYHVGMWQASPVMAPGGDPSQKKMITHQQLDDPNTPSSSTASYSSTVNNKASQMNHVSTTKKEDNTLYDEEEDDSWMDEQDEKEATDKKKQQAKKKKQKAWLQKQKQKKAGSKAESVQPQPPQQQQVVQKKQQPGQTEKEGAETSVSSPSTSPPLASESATLSVLPSTRTPADTVADIIKPPLPTTTTTTTTTTTSITTASPVNQKATKDVRRSAAEPATVLAPPVVTAVKPLAAQKSSSPQKVKKQKSKGKTIADILDAATSTKKAVPTSPSLSRNTSTVAKVEQPVSSSAHTKTGTTQQQLLQRPPYTAVAKEIQPSSAAGSKTRATSTQPVVSSTTATASPRIVSPSVQEKEKHTKQQQQNNKQIKSQQAATQTVLRRSSPAVVPIQQQPPLHETQHTLPPAALQYHKLSAQAVPDLDVNDDDYDMDGLEFGLSESTISPPLTASSASSDSGSVSLSPACSADCCTSSSLFSPANSLNEDGGDPPPFSLFSSILSPSYQQQQQQQQHFTSHNMNARETSSSASPVQLPSSLSFFCAPSCDLSPFIGPRGSLSQESASSSRSTASSTGTPVIVAASSPLFSASTTSTHSPSSSSSIPSPHMHLSSAWPLTPTHMQAMTKQRGGGGGGTPQQTYSPSHTAAPSNRCTGLQQQPYNHLEQDQHNIDLDHDALDLNDVHNMWHQQQQQQHHPCFLHVRDSPPTYQEAMSRQQQEQRYQYVYSPYQHFEPQQQYHQQMPQKTEGQPWSAVAAASVSPSPCVPVPPGYAALPKTDRVTAPAQEMCLPPASAMNPLSSLYSHSSTQSYQPLQRHASVQYCSVARAAQVRAEQ